MISRRKNRAVITGIGVMAANGNGPTQFWTSLIENRSGIGPITLFDASDMPSRIAGEIKNFSPEEHIDSKLKPKRMGRFTQLGVTAAKWAIEHAGYEDGALQKHDNIPVVMGVSTNSMDLNELGPRIHTAVAGIPVALTSAIAYMKDLQTRLMTVSNGCASSLDALASAAAMIQRGETDLAIAGGAESAVVRYVADCMLKCRKCSMKNDEPEKASCPFDRARDYGVLAEAAGIVTVENLEYAQARGATIYGEIVAHGSCTDPASAPEGGGLGKAMTIAMHDAGLSTQDIGYINAHGPSDHQMDIIETEQIKAVFGKRALSVPVTSIKGATGCPMGVGGILQAIATCLSLKNNMIPPTTNYEHPDPDCDLDYVPQKPRHANVEFALVNTHGFGRGNGTMVIRNPAA